MFLPAPTSFSRKVMSSLKYGFFVSGPSAGIHDWPMVDTCGTLVRFARACRGGAM